MLDEHDMMWQAFKIKEVDPAGCPLGRRARPYEHSYGDMGRCEYELFPNRNGEKPMQILLLLMAARPLLDLSPSLGDL
ncbi:hypothetical protein R1flu_007460 [Riccia fluitans]|uniref:Uncharacterized protein n=1 Tax=Riccia fluitans TaxID=41844 RepID=A0ABD1YZ00_9MARC